MQRRRQSRDTRRVCGADFANPLKVVVLEEGRSIRSRFSWAQCRRSHRVSAGWVTSLVISQGGNRDLKVVRCVASTGAADRVGQRFVRVHGLDGSSCDTFVGGVPHYPKVVAGNPHSVWFERSKCDIFVRGVYQNTQDCHRASQLFWCGDSEWMCIR